MSWLGPGISLAFRHWDRKWTMDSFLKLPDSGEQCQVQADKQMDAQVMVKGN